MAPPRHAWQGPESRPSADVEAVDVFHAVGVVALESAKQPVQPMRAPTMHGGGRQQRARRSSPARASNSRGMTPARTRRPPQAHQEDARAQAMPLHERPTRVAPTSPLGRVAVDRRPRSAASAATGTSYQAATGSAAMAVWSPAAERVSPSGEADPDSGQLQSHGRPFEPAPMRDAVCELGPRPTSVPAGILGHGPAWQQSSRAGRRLRSRRPPTGARPGAQRAGDVWEVRHAGTAIDWDELG